MEIAEMRIEMAEMRSVVKSIHDDVKGLHVFLQSKGYRDVAESEELVAAAMDANA